ATGLPRPLDLRGRGHLHTAAAHRAGDAAVARQEERGPDGSRGRAEGPDHDRAAGLDALGGPRIERRDEGPHPGPWPAFDVAIDGGAGGVGSAGSREGPDTIAGVLAPSAAARASGPTRWAAASRLRSTSLARTPARISPSRSSEATEPAGRKSSM